MRFMVIVKATEDSEKGIMPSEKRLADRGKFNEELGKAGGWPGGHAVAEPAVLPGRGPGGSRGSSIGVGWKWPSLLSPRLLFSFFVGCGVAFETRLVGPLWRLLFRFESREASTLETSIEDEAPAVTNLDANGNRLVAPELDGQLVQLFATLAPDERALGVRIRSGDTVRIAEVDAARRRCTVTEPTR